MVPSTSGSSYSKMTAQGSKKRSRRRTTAWTAVMSRSSNHRAMAYLCTMSSKRWPPGLALVEPPPVSLRAEGGLEIRGGLPHQRADAQGRGLADGTVGDQLLGQLERWVVHEALADAERPAGPFRCDLHGASVLHLVGCRRLHRDVLARFQRGDHVVVVQVGRRQHLDGIDGGVGQHGVEIRVVRRSAPLLGGQTTDLFIGIAHRDHVAAGIVHVPPHVHHRDIPGSDDAQPDLVHVPLRLALPTFASYVRSAARPAAGSSFFPNAPASAAAAMRASSHPRTDLSTSSVCWPVVGARAGFGSSSPTKCSGVKSWSVPTSAAGSSGKRSMNWGSSSRVWGVLTGAIGVLTRPPNSSHSAKVLVRKMSRSSLCSSRLPRA